MIEGEGEGEEADKKKEKTRKKEDDMGQRPVSFGLCEDMRVCGSIGLHRRLFLMSLFKMLSFQWDQQLDQRWLGLYLALNGMVRRNRYSLNPKRFDRNL